MGILFVTPNYKAYSEVWIERQIESLQDHIAYIGTLQTDATNWNNKIEVVSFKNAPKNPFLKQIVKHKLPFHKNIAPPPAQTFKKLIDSPKVSVVMIHYLAFAARFEKMLTQVDKPVFIHCNGYDVTWDYVLHETPNTPFFKPDYKKKVLRLADKAHFIANSNATRQKLMDIGIDSSKISVKYYGVEIPENLPKRTIKPNHLKVLYVGRLIDFKSPERVIAAFEQACEMGMDGELLMAGDGPLRVTCELLVRNSKFKDKMTLLGGVPREKVRNLMEECDIFTAHNCTGVISNQEEAFGVTIIEAMAAGLPVISGRSGGLKETVVDGETGYLFESGDVEKHAQIFYNLAQNPEKRQKLGENGFERVKNHFSIEKEKEAFLEIFGIK